MRLNRFFMLFVAMNVAMSSCAGVLPRAEAQTRLGLPEPGAMVNLSAVYQPVLIKGIKIHPENPLLFDFILDPGASGLKQDSPQLRQLSRRLVKYFLAALTIPQQDIWVNLSPYEKDRIIPRELGLTVLGRDMLAEDYLLKQLTASLIYPQKDLGKAFWERLYTKAREMYGTTRIPVNTFNKVWIVGDKAKVYVHNGTAYVVAAHLKVMLEEDYLAMKNHGYQPGDMALTVSPRRLPTSQASNVKAPQFSHKIASELVRQLIIPQIEQEVNTGKNFAHLRQIFYSMILATWYKRSLKQALLNRVYANKEKITGIDVADKRIKEEIYHQYLEAYKKGVFNFIQEDGNLQDAPRKYFSGGLTGLAIAQEVGLDDPDCAMAAREFKSGLINVKVQMQKAAYFAHTTVQVGELVMRKNKPALLTMRKEDDPGLFTPMAPEGARMELMDRPGLFGFTVRFSSPGGKYSEFFLDKNRKVAEIMLHHPLIKHLQRAVFKDMMSIHQAQNILLQIHQDTVGYRLPEFSVSKPLLEQTRALKQLDRSAALHFAEGFYDYFVRSATYLPRFKKFSDREIKNALRDFVLYDYQERKLPVDLNDEAIAQKVFQWLQKPLTRPDMLKSVSLLNKTILVTGGQSYIGFAVINELLKAGARVRVYGHKSKLESPFEQKFFSNPDVQVINGDLNNERELTAALKDIDLVIHLAASSNVPESWEQPSEYIQNNTIGTLRLLDVMRRVGCNKIVTASSYLASEVALDSSASPYVFTKSDMEKEVEYFSKAGLHYVTERFGQVNGANRIQVNGEWHWHGQRTVGGPKRLIENLITTALDPNPHKKPVDVVPAKMYPLDVEDAAKALVRGSKHLLAGGQNLTLTVTPPEAVSTLDIVKFVQELAEKRALTLPVNQKEPQAASATYTDHLRFESKMTSMELGMWNLKPNLKQIIEETFEWNLQEENSRKSAEIMGRNRKFLKQSDVIQKILEPAFIFRKYLVLLAYDMHPKADRGGSGTAATGVLSPADLTKWMQGAENKVNQIKEEVGETAAWIIVGRFPLDQVDQWLNHNRPAAQRLKKSVGAQNAWVLLARQDGRSKRKFPQIENLIYSYILQLKFSPQFDFKIRDDAFYRLLHIYHGLIKGETSLTYEERSQYLKEIFAQWEIKTNRAMLTRGGIDLNARNLMLEVESDGSMDAGGMASQFEQQDFSGLYPVVLKIDVLSKNYVW